jgi:endonuclease/exonuclease/phosphatase family metal-dependent hydrolase
VDIVTTHLGLGKVERQLQMDELLGSHWLGHPHRNPRCVFCGDFNSSPRSRVYRRIASRFADAQLAIKGRRPGGTWFSPFPLARLDHVFVAGGLSVMDARVARTRLAGVASDHLPLVVDVEVPSHTERGNNEGRPEAALAAVTS